MADEQDSQKGPRPASPAIPPFRGAGGAPRAPSSGAPDTRRSARPFIGARPASSPRRPTNDAAEPQQPSAELPWLDISAGQVPKTAHPLPFPPFDAGAGEDVGPEETAQALAGLPYFDGDGDQHSGREPSPARSSGKMHRVEFDVADVLERIAGRIRDGNLPVPNVDPVAGEGAALAAVLAALLRQRGR